MRNTASVNNGRLLLALATLALSMAALQSCGASLPSPRPLPGNIKFAGEWDTNWGQMTLSQRGKHVHGRYKGFRNGSITGDIEGNRLLFKWTQVKPRLHGRGYLLMSQDGKRMEGRWGYLIDHFEGGRWWANRIEGY